MTYFGKTDRNVLTSAVGSAIISKLSLMRRHRKKKSKDTGGMGLRQLILKKLLEVRKKVVDKDDCL